MEELKIICDTIITIVGIIGAVYVIKNIFDQEW